MIYVTLYVSFLAAIYSFSLMAKSWHVKTSMLLLTVSIVVPAIGLREDFGTDYLNYFSIHNDIVSHNISFQEPLFSLLFSISKDFNTSLLVVSGFSVFFLFIGTIQYKYSLALFTVCMINYFGNFHGSIRYGLAIGFVLLFFSFVERRKILLSIIVYFCAVSIHYSAIILFLGYVALFLSQKQLRINFIICLFFLLLLISRVGDEIMVVSFELLKNNVPEGIYFNKLESYTQQGRHSLTTGIPITTLAKKTFIIICLIFAYSEILKEGNEKTITRFRFYFWVLLLGYAILFTVTPVFQTLGLRLSLWFTYIEPVLLVTFRTKYSYVFWAIALIMAILTCISSIMQYPDAYNTYKLAI